MTGEAKREHGFIAERLADGDIRCLPKYLASLVLRLERV
jgi:hypothetical protein